MRIEHLHEYFHQRIALITAYQRAARDVLGREVVSIKGYISRKADKPDEYTGPMSSMNFSYRNPIDGGPAYYGQHTRTAEQVQEYLELQLNKQYQWLLAEAYEEFEDFIELAYASAAFFDRSFWPLSDYGNISMNEINCKDWSWYVDQSRKKKGKPDSMLTRFRERLPEFSKLEKQNALKANLRLSLSLVTQMRHHIVHTSGSVKNREEFIKNIIDRAAQPSKGKLATENIEYINSYFLSPPHDNIIALIDIPHPKSNGWIKFYTSTFDELVGALLSTAHCLCDALAKHQANPGKAAQHS